ncbi:hypothetical protein C8R43DRAFT_964639 [Mycena crocata]|nr:hypothetical protein C8R43DRAFT_964639 [Mycena crocata]
MLDTLDISRSGYSVYLPINIAGQRRTLSDTLGITSYPPRRIFCSKHSGFLSAIGVPTRQGSSRLVSVIPQFRQWRGDGQVPYCQASAEEPEHWSQPRAFGPVKPGPRAVLADISEVAQQPLEPFDGFPAVRKNGSSMAPRSHMKPLTSFFGGGAIRLRTAKKPSNGSNGFCARSLIRSNTFLWYHLLCLDLERNDVFGEVPTLSELEEGLDYNFWEDVKGFGKAFKKPYP